MSTPKNDGLRAAEFCAAFPFYMVLGEDLRVERAGPVWSRFYPVLGESFAERFDVVRPLMGKPCHDDLVDLCGDVFHLKLRHMELQMRGQIIGRARETVWLLSPLVNDLAELTRVGLSYSDLALHDPTVDLMVVMKTQATSLGDAKRMTQKMRKGRERLAEANMLAEKARAEAEAAGAAKHQFLTTMSHEIRTPLNGVLGMAQLLQDTILNQEQSRFLETLVKSSDALLVIINDILDFSKFESGKLLLEHIEFDPRLMLEQVADMLAPQAQEKGVGFVTCAEDSVPSALIGDETRVRQVLINLVNNAIKFTDDGHVAVTLAFEDGRLRGEVADSGIGISESAQAGLFKPFSQADASTTRRFGGTGLGLSICKLICEAMGGTVSVTSEESVGSKFYFESELEAAGEYVPQLLHWSGPVAVVEVGVEHRGAWERVLAELGAQVHTYASAGEVEDLEWAAVLLPVDMQVPSFIDVTRVFLIADIAQTPEARAAAAQFAGYFTRPCRPSQLRAHWEAASQAGAADLTLVGAQSAVHVAPGLRVLLVEDNPVNQLLAKAFLKKVGAIVTVAGDGVEALKKLAEGPQDVVLMDCQMPVMDGFEATRLIRAEYGTDLPVIAMTANAMPGDRERCLEAGMDDYLAKPVALPLLIEKLAHYGPDSQAA
ncbi:MAG: two-component system sensor histidine kinase/response regulator [Planctomycetota bacterium]|jgi:two-component system sensor histidine kinase/response regulator